MKAWNVNFKSTENSIKLNEVKILTYTFITIIFSISK